MSIIIVEPLSSGRDLVKAARRVGLKPIVFTADQGERQLDAVCRREAACVTVVDTYDVHAVFEAAQSAVRDNKVKAIVPGWEYCVGVVATVSSRLSLPHMSETSAAAARNKFFCREQLKSAGVDVPRYALIRSLHDIESAARTVGFPAVVKPVDGGGSLLVRKVAAVEELRETIQRCENGLLDVGHHVGMPFMLEEYIGGKEFSIEGYLDSGVPHVVAITEKKIGADPFFIEMGHVVEAELSDRDRKDLIAYIEGVVRTIKLNVGAFHAEARLSDRGPILVEINCRLGGGRIPRLVELTKGLSLAETMVRSYCGFSIPIATDRSYKGNGVAGVRFLTLDGAARFDSAHGVDDVCGMPGFEEIEIYYNAGDAVPGLTDFRGRIGHVLFTAESRSTLDERLELAVKEIRLKTLSCGC